MTNFLIVTILFIPRRLREAAQQEEFFQYWDKKATE